MSMEVCDYTERSKTDSSNVQDTTKTIKDCGMPCCTWVEGIQVEYSVSSHLKLFLRVCKKKSLEKYNVTNIESSGKRHYNPVVCNIICLNL